MSKYVWFLLQQQVGWYERFMKLPFDVAKLRSLLPKLRVVQRVIDIYNTWTVLGVVTTLGVLFWLYYELGYVAPVCPYYTGTELPPYLNKFKTIGKSYRPPFYMFAPHCQWIYLICFCRLKLAYHWLQYLADKSRSKIVSALYKVGAQLLRLVFRTFFFTKIFRNQAVVAVRELVEAHNGAIVVLDYYLPKWAGKFCSNCGKFSAEVASVTRQSGMLNAAGSASTNMGDDDSGRRTAGTATADNTDNVHYSDAKPPEFMAHTPINKAGFSREDNNYNYYHNHPSPPKMVSASQYAMDGMHSSELEESSEDKLQSLRNATYGDGKTADHADAPPRKVIRGVLVVIGDTAVSYSVCNQPMACRCGMPAEPNSEIMCSGCCRSTERDQEGLNIETPGTPTVRFLIGDALEVGYACVQVHLNVNLGMASEAFPTWTGLRCFPLTLYSDVLLDLDAALKKVGDRYPNLPINCVGVGFGANILMEYLAVGSSGKPISAIEDPTRNPQKGFGYLPERRSVVTKRGQWPEIYANDWRNQSEATQPTHQSSATMGIVSFGFGATNAVETGAASPSSQYSRSASPVCQMVKQQRASVTVNASDPNYESFCHLYKVMEKVGGSVSPAGPPRPTTATSTSSYSRGRGGGGDGSGGRGRGAGDNTPANGGIVNLSEGHFNFNEENEECMYETSVIYPLPPQSEVVLNTKRISAAVCVNLNLRPGGNALYKYAWQRKIHMRSFYGRYCYSAFRHHLIALLREVHCRRANDSIQKECYHYRCCHYAKVAFKHGWLRHLIRHVRNFREGFDDVMHHDGVEQLLLAVHREYRQSYRHMQSKASNGYINYGAGIYKRFGARTASDFKFSALMTLRYVYTQVDQDNRSRIETLSGPAMYKIVNRRVNTNLRIGKANLYSGINKLLNQTGRRSQDPKVFKHMADLINHEYTQNVANIRRNFTSIEIPTLLLSSLDNSQCTLEDIDILDVIKNPNIVYYVAKSGGYSTFLTGTYPSAWFSGPILEFLDEMSSRRVII